MTDPDESDPFSAPDRTAEERALAESLFEAVLDRLRETVEVFDAAVIAGRPDGWRYFNELAESGWLVSLPSVDGAGRAYPVFQFAADMSILPIVAGINQALGAGDEPIAVTSWWATPNAQLDGVAPFVLVADPGAAPRLLAAAEHESRIDN